MSDSGTLHTFLDTDSPEMDQLVQELQKLYPNSVHIPVIDEYFRIYQFLDENRIPIKCHCAENLMTYVAGVKAPGTYTEQSINPRDICTLVSFSYKETNFFLHRVKIEVPGDDHDLPERVTTIFWNFVYEKPTGVDLVNEDAVGRSLIKEVYDWMCRLDKTIWVFNRDYWYQDKELTKAVESTTWDNLILEESLINGLQRDTTTFFSKAKIYESHGITWKRGILLLGPPGNGKTETLKALINSTQQKVLYVKSFDSYQASESAVCRIFEHVRQLAPCILIIEDIDSIVTKYVKSFFLNEMDGFAKNRGVLTIATTNHPEWMDDAMLNRPSRFDVKYDFALPNEQLRKQFALKWIKKARGSASEVEYLFAQSDDEAIARDIARKTEGWSFAFLKELFVSFLLRYAHEESLDPAKIFTPEDIENMLFDQISKLGVQIKFPTSYLSRIRRFIGRKLKRAHF